MNLTKWKENVYISYFNIQLLMMNISWDKKSFQFVNFVTFDIAISFPFKIMRTFLRVMFGKNWKYTKYDLDFQN